MKLREKWDKQNNSVKLLLKKLKRHDTRVVAVSVVIATILCGGLIYLSTPVVTANAQEKFEESERVNKEDTGKKLDELHDYLSQIDETISDNSEDIKSFSEKNKEDDESRDEYKNVVNEKAGALSGNLSTIHQNISETKTRLETLKEMIDSENKADKEKIASEFALVNSELDKLTKDYNDTKEKTTDLMDEIKKAVNSGNENISKESMDRYKELLDKLTAFNSEMDQSSKDLLSKSNLKFDELYGKLSGMISDLEEEMGKRNDEVIASNDKKINEAIASSDKRFTEINNNFDQQFNSYETKMTTDINGVKEYIDTKATAVSEKLDQVFQRVSNGKKLLASALLTKGVKIGEDATFAEFAKAIQNIPQQMVLDSGETAAEIEYEYHYHKNGKGKTVNASLVSAADKGGCYNTAVYHKHTSSCYKTQTVYIISTKQSVTDRGWVKDDPDGSANNRYRCSYCGAEFVANSARHREKVYSIEEAKKRDGKIEDVEQTTVLSCGKNDGQLEGYCVSCGFAHGQVASAHLKFQGKNAKYNTKVAAINTSNAIAPASLSTRMGKSMMSLIGMDFGSGDDEIAAGPGASDSAKELSSVDTGADSAETAAISEGMEQATSGASGSDAEVTTSSTGNNEGNVDININVNNDNLGTGIPTSDVVTSSDAGNHGDMQDIDSDDISGEASEESAQTVDDSVKDNSKTHSEETDHADDAEEGQ